MEIGNNHIHIYNSKENVYDALSKSMLKQSILATRANGRFTISLAGGSTPRPLYEMMTTKDFSSKMPWSTTKIFWGDERLVPPDNDASNFKMVNDALLAKVPILQENIFPIPTDRSPNACALAYEDTLHSQFKSRPPKFDMILLGLGDDGHTASIFPNTQVVHEIDRWVREVFHPIQKKFRITLTASVINQAIYIAFVVIGKNKAKALKKVLMGEFDPVTWPAQLIAQSGNHVHWYLDEEAAEELKTDEK